MIYAEHRTIVCFISALREGMRFEPVDLRTGHPPLADGSPRVVTVLLLISLNRFPIIQVLYVRNWLALADLERSATGEVAGSQLDTLFGPSRVSRCSAAAVEP